MEGKLLHSTGINKSEWDELVSGSLQGSIFAESGYLDIILPGEWSGIVVYEDNTLIAIMPVMIKQKWGFSYALQPVMAKYWGIIFANKGFNSVYKELSFKKKAVNAILDCIPNDLCYVSYNFHPEFDYPLPFYWKSYRLNSSFTYILDVMGITEKEIFNSYSPELKNSIRTAQKNEITIKEDQTSAALIEILEKNKNIGKIIYEPKHYGTLSKVLEFGLKHGKCFSLTARDNKDNPVSSSIYMMDNKSIYALIHVMAKYASKTDALSLLVHHAVLKSAELKLKFDFLGSMIEPVEAFNRRFGAQPVPFQTISKKNQLLSLILN